ncbi:hypothetical protein AB0O01_23975 [Streptomyces sp. NPDC093252]|uniref:TolB family protein n=1 Tax=Streptomyces sp. NPDC093252 TaxID=3154980 RepID=UPI00343FF978
MPTPARALTVATIAATALALTATTATAAPPPRTERITLSATGGQLTGGSGGPALSADGRHAAFASDAADVVPGDTNGVSDVFVRDLRRGTVERVTRASDGTPADAGTYTARLSADGRYVAFTTRASNLVDWPVPQAPYSADVYVHDRRTGTTERVTVAADGGSAGVSDGLGLSADGRLVAFTAAADRIEGGGAPPHARAYVVDRVTGERRTISDRLPADWYVQNLRLSADGTHAAYVPRHPRGGPGQLWLADLRTGEQRQLNLTPDGEPTGGGPAGLSLSADGSRVAYGSFDDRVVPGAPEYTWELYLYDARTGTTRWITHEGAGGLGGGLLSPDGRRLAYTHETERPDGTTVGNIHIRELDGPGRTVRATDDIGGGALTEGYSAATDFAARGRVLGLYSTSSRLVADDTNGEGDGFTVRP